MLYNENYSPVKHVSNSLAEVSQIVGCSIDSSVGCIETCEQAADDANTVQVGATLSHISLCQLNLKYGNSETSR